MGEPVMAVSLNLLCLANSVCCRVSPARYDLEEPVKYLSAEPGRGASVGDATHRLVNTAAASPLAPDYLPSSASRLSALLSRKR